MPKEERLSAIARRRRLNGNTSSTLDSPSNTSRSQSPAKLVKVNDVSVVSEPATSLPDDVAPDENTFGALVTHDAVQFSNFREIEQLSNGAVKIRLSKGQNCFVSGSFTLWVKDGAVEFCGATLEATPVAYHVSVSTYFEVPAIVALTKTVELELGSEVGHSLPWSGSSLHQFGSFSVHGYGNLGEDVAPSIARSASGNIATAAARKIKDYEYKMGGTTGLAILVCGRQSPGIPSLLVCIINSLLTTKSSAKGKGPSQGALLLDLDSQIPLFAPPGTVSLVHVRKPILGSSFTQLGGLNAVTETDPVHILEMQYYEGSERSTPEPGRYDSLVRFARGVWQRHYRDCTFIIRANDWLEDLDREDVAVLERILAPDIVVCFGAETASNSGRLGESISTATKSLPLIIVPVVNTKDASLHVQHELLLQSYFHFRGYQHSSPCWSDLPLVLDQQCYQWLSWGTAVSHISEILVHGIHVSVNDRLDAINGCVVAAISDHSMNGISQPDVRARNSSGRPGHSVDETENSLTNGSNCLGFAVIADFNQSTKEVCLFTPISRFTFDSYRKQGKEVSLVVQRADTDGRFDTAWVYLETELVSEGQKPANTVYRQKISVSRGRRHT